MALCVCTSSSSTRRYALGSGEWESELLFTVQPHVSHICAPPTKYNRTYHLFGYMFAGATITVVLSAALSAEISASVAAARSQEFPTAIVNGAVISLLGFIALANCICSLALCRSVRLRRNDSFTKAYRCRTICRLCCCCSLDRPSSRPTHLRQPNEDDDDDDGSDDSATDADIAASHSIVLLGTATRPLQAVPDEALPG
jgi:hypothetical protein